MPKEPAPDKVRKALFCGADGRELKSRVHLSENSGREESLLIKDDEKGDEVVGLGVHAIVVLARVVEDAGRRVTVVRATRVLVGLDAVRDF